MISEETRKNYWAVIRRTRQSGRISQSVIDRVEESWKSFDEDVVEEALKIHQSRYHSYKEQYTIGIMRNLQREKAQGKQVGKKAWSPAEQHDYDFEQLEKDLLAN